MALMHKAELNPGKLELLAAWLPTRSWYPGPAAPEVTRVAACRFDDPAGEVGVETMLVRAGDGPVLHTPLTYRAAPLDGAEAWLVGTTEHSVLGRRWVYDACCDPVYAAVLAHAIATGGTEAEEFVSDGESVAPRAASMFVRGSGDRAEGPAVHSVVRVDEGSPTRIVTDTVELVVTRIVDSGHTGEALMWITEPTPLPLAYLG